MKLALACLVALGCSQGDHAREGDCARVRAIVDQAKAEVPRRYWDSPLRDELNVRPPAINAGFDRQCSAEQATIMPTSAVV